MKSIAKCVKKFVLGERGALKIYNANMLSFIQKRKRSQKLSWIQCRQIFQKLFIYDQLLTVYATERLVLGHNKNWDL